MRRKVTKVGVFMVCLFLAMATVLSLPVGDENSRDSDQVFSDSQRMRTSMNLIGDATRFLRSWFQRLRTSIHSSNTHSEQEQIRLKRSTNQEEHGHTDEPEIKVNELQSNESAFEIYEKKFLINQTLNYLKQIYYYSKYRQQISEHSTSKSGSQLNITSVPVSSLETSNETNRVDALLSAKMNELNSLSMNQIEDIFQNVKRAAKTGVVDPGITSLCCPQG